MPALELVTGLTTAAGAAFTAATPLQGNSFTLRNAAEGSEIFLVAAWLRTQLINLNGQGRIRSPLMHDNVRGISFLQNQSDNPSLFPSGLRQRLFSQDSLTLEIIGSAAGGDLDFLSILVYYADLPGVQGTFLTPAEVLARAINLTTLPNTITALATGEYGTAESIVAEADTLKANTDYALLGCQYNQDGVSVRYRASAWGNLGVGIPLIRPFETTLTTNWFYILSNAVDLPLIPVFNSADKDNVLVDLVQNENATNVSLVTMLAELSG